MGRRGGLIVGGERGGGGRGHDGEGRVARALLGVGGERGGGGQRERGGGGGRGGEGRVARVGGERSGALLGDAALRGKHGGVRGERRLGKPTPLSSKVNLHHAIDFNGLLWCNFSHVPR